jgi:hypothetical protein
MWIVLLRIILALSLVLPPTNLRIRETGPMAVEYISAETVIQTTSDSSQSITIPSDCNAANNGLIIVTVSGYTGAINETLLDELCFDGGSTLDFSTEAGLASFWSSDEEQIRNYYMTADDANFPGTGSKTIYWSSSIGYTEGYQIGISYWKNVDPDDPIGDTDTRVGGSTAFTSSLTGVDGSDDIGVISAYAYDNAPNVDPTGYGQTAIYESASYNQVGLSLGYELGESALRGEGNDAVWVAFALNAAAAGGTTVECTGAGAVAITGLAATISAGTTIACTGAGAVAITGAAATVSAGTTVAATTGTIAITGLQATIGAGTTIDCSTGAVAIASNAATISAGTTVAATTGAIAITGLQASIVAGSGISCTTGAIGITGLAATVSAGTTIAASTGAIAITGLQAEVDTSGATAVDCTTGAIAITGLQATISAGKIIDTTTGAIAITGNQAAIWQGTTIDCTGAGALTIAGYGADVIAAVVVECSTGAVVITGNQAQVVSAETAVGRVTASSSGAKPGTTITGAKPRITITT